MTDPISQMFALGETNHMFACVHQVRVCLHACVGCKYVCVFGVRICLHACTSCVDVCMHACNACMFLCVYLHTHVGCAYVFLRALCAICLCGCTGCIYVCVLTFGVYIFLCFALQTSKTPNIKIADITQT